MRGFLVKLAVFCFLCICIDWGVGSVLISLNNHARSGFTQRDNFISQQVDSDILIFGSSRAAHHYVPSILSDSLQMSCYNCGLDGKGIIYAYGKLNMILNRVCPKFVILDFISYLDLEKGEDAAKDLTPLRLYYDDPEVESMFEDVDVMEKWKMMSVCYPFNSKLLQLINDNLFADPLSIDHGYLPLYGKLSYEPVEKKRDKVVETDTLKRKYLIKFIEKAQTHAQLIVFVSPIYGKTDLGLYNELKCICKKYGVPVYDHLADDRITRKRDFFVDPVHLNDEGARIYTKLIIGEIRKATISGNP